MGLPLGGPETSLYQPSTLLLRCNSPSFILPTPAATAPAVDAAPPMATKGWLGNTVQRGGNGPENTLISVAAVVSNIKLAKGNSPACQSPGATGSLCDTLFLGHGHNVTNGCVWRWGIPVYRYTQTLPYQINRETSEKPLDIHWILEGPYFQNPGPTRTAQPEVSSWTPCLSFKAMDPFDPIWTPW